MPKGQHPNFVPFQGTKLLPLPPPPFGRLSLGRLLHTGRASLRSDLAGSRVTLFVGFASCRLASSRLTVGFASRARSAFGLVATRASFAGLAFIANRLPVLRVRSTGFCGSVVGTPDMGSLFGVPEVPVPFPDWPGGFGLLPLP